MGQNRFVERALKAGLEEAVEIGEFQHPFAGFSLRVHMLLQSYLCFGQRAGLVRAEDIH